jgi:hypothetical protein
MFASAGVCCDNIDKESYGISAELVFLLVGKQNLCVCVCVCSSKIFISVESNWT